MTELLDELKAERGKHQQQEDWRDPERGDDMARALACECGQPMPCRYARALSGKEAE